MATLLVFAGRWAEKRYHCTCVCTCMGIMKQFNAITLFLKSCSMWMYWQKYLQWFYSDDAVY